MKRIECEREAEILDAVRCGRWPRLAEPELVRHAHECPICSEVALIAPLICEHRDAELAEVAVPSAGFVWWKAELLARRADAERATKPIAIVEKIGAAIGLVALVSIILSHWHVLIFGFRQAWTAWREDFGVHAAYPALWQPPYSSLLLLAAAACFALVVVTIFLARAEE